MTKRELNQVVAAEEKELNALAAGNEIEARHAANWLKGTAREHGYTVKELLDVAHGRAG